MKAKHNFISRKDTEISINKGDIIKVLDQHKSGWWKGEVNGNVGRFPSNYCVQFEDTSEQNSSVSIDINTTAPSKQDNDSKVEQTLHSLMVV